MSTTTKDRPILFSGPMVKAILEGRKTQTRRIARLNETLLNHPDVKDSAIEAALQISPYQVGMCLWVRETWSDYLDALTNERGVVYRASHGLLPGQVWKPSIHMPRWASRLTLEITDVRVERLQDISHHDAMCEGVGMESSDSLKQYGYKAGFANLWESINGKGSWDANPWVWVIKFRRLSNG